MNKSREEFLPRFYISSRYTYYSTSSHYKSTYNHTYYSTYYIPAYYRYIKGYTYYTQTKYFVQGQSLYEYPCSSLMTYDQKAVEDDSCFARLGINDVRWDIYNGNYYKEYYNMIFYPVYANTKIFISMYGNFPLDQSQYPTINLYAKGILLTPEIDGINLLSGREIISENISSFFCLDFEATYFYLHDTQYYIPAYYTYIPSYRDLVSAYYFYQAPKRYDQVLYSLYHTYYYYYNNHYYYSMITN